MQNKLKLLDASVRHLGTDINYVVLENMYAHLKDKVDFYFDTPVESVEVLYDENTAGADACSLQEAHTDNVSGYAVKTADSTYESRYCIISVGRSGSKWMEKVCNDLDIPTKSNRVDIGVRVELPALIFSHLTDELYESKIVYRTQLLRIMCVHSA